MAFFKKMGNELDSEPQMTAQSVMALPSPLDILSLCILGAENNQGSFSHLFSEHSGSFGSWLKSSLHLITPAPFPISHR